MGTISEGTDSLPVLSFEPTGFGYSSAAKPELLFCEQFLPDVHRSKFFSTIEGVLSWDYANFALSKPMLRPINNRVPNSIRYYRRRANMRLFELAHYVGISSPANLANWEMGRKMPSADNLLKLSAVLMVPPEILFLDRLKQLREQIRARKAQPIKKPL